MATCPCYKLFAKSSKQDKGLNADSTCEEKPQRVAVGLSFCWPGRKETLFAATENKTESLTLLICLCVIIL